MPDTFLLSPETLLWVFIGTYHVIHLLELYLNIRQRRTVSKKRKPLKSFADTKTYDRAKSYALSSTSFAIFSDLYNVILLTVYLKLHGLYYCWEWAEVVIDESTFWLWPKSWNPDYCETMCFAVISISFSRLLRLPLIIYESFFLDKKSGLSQDETFLDIIKRLIKKVFIEILITSLVSVLAVKIIYEGGPYFHFYLWFFSLFVTFFVMSIYPLGISPLLEKREELQISEPELDSRLKKLASRINFPLVNILIVQGTSPAESSHHSNSYVYGFFRKRVALFDTLLQGRNLREKTSDVTFTDDEIEAVMAHEIGHWKFHHLTQLEIFHSVDFLFVFSLFAYLYESDVLYLAFGFPRGGEEPIVVGLVIVFQFVLSIYNTVKSLFMNLISRSFEFQADAFVAHLGLGDALKRALVKFERIQCTSAMTQFPYSDRLFSIYYNAHPTLVERLKAIDRECDSSKIN